MLHFVFALPSNPEDYAMIKSLTKLVFYYIDHVKDLKLTPKEKSKAIERRRELDKEQRKQAMAERQEQLQKKKYQEATPEQLERMKQKELRKRQNARVKV